MMAKRNDLRKHSAFRLVFQSVWFALTNGYVYGFVKGKIYTGKAKSVCVPGLNCYSCPGAVGACPIGSLQAKLGGKSSGFPFYVLGFLMLFGSLFGRFVCGWLCPFGLVQELLFKIPVFRKLKKLPGHNVLVKVKYAVLALLVIILPIVIRDAAGNGSPRFCEFLCPSGTLFGGIPLTLGNEGLQSAIGFRFFWKLGILAGILILSVKVYRPFCKYLCPLGAAYSFFNPFSLYRLSVDGSKCVSCGACEKTCKMGINPSKNPNSPECIRCGDCVRACQTGAISKGILKKEILK